MFGRRNSGKSDIKVKSNIVHLRQYYNIMYKLDDAKISVGDIIELKRYPFLRSEYAGLKQENNNSENLVAYVLDKKDNLNNDILSLYKGDDLYIAYVENNEIICQHCDSRLFQKSALCVPQLLQDFIDDIPCKDIKLGDLVRERKGTKFKEVSGFSSFSSVTDKEYISPYIILQIDEDSVKIGASDTKSSIINIIKVSKHLICIL